MREIKLRSWSKSAKTMHPVWLKTDNENGEYILMQYTGLLDKHGKEIFEGDVVRDQFSVREIIWHMPEGANAIYGFVQRGIDKDEWIGLNRIENEFEVIGNIYENPELLTPPTNSEAITR